MTMASTGFNSGLDIGKSYYVATANPAPDHPALTGDAEADLVVVGGGCTGLSAALHAAERGLKVVLLEGGKIGWGASGRNGGQIIPGLRKGAKELVRAFGPERAKALFDLAFEARGLVLDIIERHGIECDLRLTGHLVGAVNGSDMREFEEEAECLAKVMDFPHVEILSAAEARRMVDTPYLGASFETLGGHMHPLNYTLGLAGAASAAGVTIHENSVAVRLEREPFIRVFTDKGSVRARHVVLAGDALLNGLEPRVNSRIMPIGNYIVATEPLGARNVIPSNAAVSDTLFVVNYYRMSADGRLLFGGGERYTPSPPADIGGFVRPHMEKTFPQLRGCRIDHAWGGLVSVTTSRLPHVGHYGEVYFAHGYSGKGVILSTLSGKLLAEAITGDASRLDLFSTLTPLPFPGGTALRGPLYVLGMLWYAMRDRLRR
ncbi:MAG: FAD-binding oxidoreductase [Mesorhizobium sp.]|nr:FAD-binding oxidoreductase [Mesorhizobium sp. M1A.T.Ca.IN.004.03.1.1]RUV99897.1 FAD-binding oxidoreductase [Mesorhizobium sp. M1A.F.Ca.IN.020.04.1.1]RUW07013.1 FAD-binding oxidoreductase [Mesorhizobium sp. M1A.F.Ca.IN.020.03.1.1]RWG10473.1 MAG: FAD-binding oxidoreductase [Mesorhizobium sp.]RWG12850.1 MAG: FAD-binding oxidoreductase [Mesorhizobium sp.]